jgi:hypothetical protein
MGKLEDIKQWLKVVSNNRNIALVAGMERQVSKLPPDDPRTMVINAIIAKKREKLDRALIAEQEAKDGSVEP